MATPKVRVRRIYEVDCVECGVIEADHFKRDAEETAKRHRARHREEDKARA